MNARKYIKNLINNVVNTKLVNRPPIRLRIPVNKEGRWIGWTEEQIEEFLEYLRKLPQKNQYLK